MDVHEYCREVRPSLLGTVLHLVGDAQVAEELTQETLARVWVHWAKLDVMEETLRRAWTFRVAKNFSHSWWRRKMAEYRAIQRVPAHPVIQVDSPETITVRNALGMLSSRQRTALVLRYYADLPVDVVAALMSCAPGTVKALTSQGLQRLRQLIGDLKEA